MKSPSMEKHFETLENQRTELFPVLENLSFEQLWERPAAKKWSIGETMYHLYLIARMLRVAAQITIPTAKPFAQVKREKPFAKETYDIYKAYNKKNKKGMKAPFILDPPKKVYRTLDFSELHRLLETETFKIEELVNGLDEDIAGHIIFPDPIADYPNLIQSVHLLAIHEAHHFAIVQRQLDRQLT